jgi:hypothetical protein
VRGGSRLGTYPLYNYLSKVPTFISFTGQKKAANYSFVVRMTPVTLVVCSSQEAVSIELLYAGFVSLAKGLGRDFNPFVMPSHHYQSTYDPDYS